MISDNVRQELAELVDEFDQAADGPSADDEHDAAVALVDAVRALLETE